MNLPILKCGVSRVRKKMKKEWTSSWKGSKQPRKQRKYIANAPLHIKQKFLGVHLSSELKKKYGKRTLPIRKGDKVKIMRGGYKGKTGAISKVLIKLSKVHIEGIENIRKDGTKALVKIEPSNLIITELNTDDKRRLKRVKKQEKKETKQETKEGDKTK